ncbi:MAG: helix-turn-helix domain-containing protein [Chloroflexi bacterium]|nr:helix-turn-helix domain-containing protein [Chloroflexota bacterium]
MSEAHRHNNIELMLVVCGTVTIEFGSIAHDFPERTFCAFWAALPHRITHSTAETFVFSVTLPLAYFLKWNPPALLTKPLLNGQPLCAPSNAMDEMNMRRWRADLSDSQQPIFAEQEHIVRLEIEARLRRMALSLASAAPSSDEPRAASSLGAGKAERMAHFITANFADPLRVEQIARSAHVHPTYAMHIFRKTYGISLIDFLTQRRIAHAQMLLATTDTNIADVALASGFNTTSRFYTAFQNTCGKSPRTYRESLR